METKDYDEIEQLIGYKFERRALLQQAFTRKSYTQETHDGDNNEVLEFIGDKALDTAVVRAMSDYFGKVNDRDEYVCNLNEGKLTQLKARLVESKMLAHRIDELGFAKHLILGKGDIKKNAQDDMSVKEDLFEAIVGAVAIDSEWDVDAIQDVVELMLDLDYYLENGFGGDNNYVALVQQWCQKTRGELPHYIYQDTDEYDVNRMLRMYSIVGERDTIENENSDGPVTCKLYIDDGNPFVARGYSKSQARLSAAECAYNYLDGEGLLYTLADEMGEPTLETAISKLNELSQKGYFSQPEYVFTETHNHNGDSVWRCECHIAEYRYYYEKTSTVKREAKRGAAYDMLTSILHADGNDNNNDWLDEEGDE